jgi:hypothetical protein
MDEARSKVAKWEIDSLANMIRPASTADEQILRIDLFPEIMETDRSQRSEVREVEGRQKNEHLDRLRRELESVPAPTTGKTEEEDLMDLLDPS